MKKTLNILKALSDETRLRIINLLYEKRELCVCDIMEVLGITQTKASRHLSYLKNTGLVNDRKSAQWVYYSMMEADGTEFVDKLVHGTLRRIEEFKNDLSVLGNHLENKNKACV